MPQPSPTFRSRTVLTFDPAGNVTSSVPYSNVISGGLKNPRSESWNVEVDRQVLENLLVRVAYQQRNTVDDLVVNPETTCRGQLAVVGQLWTGFLSRVSAHWPIQDTPTNSECLLRAVEGHWRPQRLQPVLRKRPPGRDPTELSRSAGLRCAQPLPGMGRAQRALES